MSGQEQQISKPVFKVVLLQTGIAVMFSSAVAIFADKQKALSAVAGGSIAVIGSLMYAMMVVGRSGNAASIMKTHFRAEMIKIFVTVVLFVLTLLLFQSAALLWLILGFAVATLAYWFALLTV